MLDQSSASLLTVIVSVILGALVGGGAVLVVMDRAVKGVLNSPLLIQQSQLLAASWPAPVRDFIHDAGTLAELATTTTTTSTPPGTTSTITVTPGASTNPETVAGRLGDVPSGGDNMSGSNTG